MISRAFAALLLLVATMPLWSWSQPPVVQLTPEEVAARLQRAGDDPVQILALVPLTDKKTARDLRKRVYSILLDRRLEASQKELNQLTQTVSRILPRAIGSPEELVEVLGNERTISRQLLYRRYVEQWIYQRPLPLVINIDFPKGKDPVLRSAHAWSE